MARWRLNDGSRLTMAINLGERDVPANEIACGRCLFESRADVASAAAEGRLLHHGAAAWLDTQDMGEVSA